MLIRRTVSAMGRDLGVFAVQFAWAEWIRAHIVPPVTTVTTVTPMNPSTSSVVNVNNGIMNLQAAPTLTQQGAWVLSGQVINASGHPAQVPAVASCLGANCQACGRPWPGSTSGN